MSGSRFLSFRRRYDNKNVRTPDLVSSEYFVVPDSTQHNSQGRPMKKPNMEFHKASIHNADKSESSVVVSSKDPLQLMAVRKDRDGFD